MTIQTSHQTETETSGTRLISSTSRKTALRAQWQLVDGKLVCKWFKDPD